METRADASWLIFSLLHILVIKNIQAIILTHLTVTALLQMSIISYYYAFAGIGDIDKPEVFPQDRMFEVGSRVTFCCILPAGEIFNKMYLMGYSDSNTNTTRISNQTYTLTVQLNQASKGSCTNVVCETSIRDNGACAYIGCKYDLVLRRIL